MPRPPLLPKHRIGLWRRSSRVRPSAPVRRAYPSRTIMRPITPTLVVLVAAWLIWPGLSPIRAATAVVGGFPLLAALVYVADEHPALYAGAGMLQASVPLTKRSPENSRWRLRAPYFLTLCETHSSGSIRRETSLLTAPVRLIVVSTVVGNWGPTTTTGADRIDLRVGSGCGVDIGYLLS